MIGLEEANRNFLVPVPAYKTGAICMCRKRALVIPGGCDAPVLPQFPLKPVLAKCRKPPLLAAVVKVVVAFLLVIQAAFSVVVASFLGAVVGLRCTSSIGFQLRVEPDQRFGLALRAAA